MRQSGKMDRSLIVQRLTGTTVSAYGGPFEAWGNLVTLRAKKLSGIATDETRTDIAVTDTLVKLQTYYYDGLTLEDRVLYENATYTIKSLSEIGRRRGLEFHIEKLGP